ncbi:hypothetical protein [Methanoregula sp.]|uniref:hypothetical protein n=1 Tax=Methanoregula sp. TaxID=2052170 RepID=UPI003C768ADB
MVIVSHRYPGDNPCDLLSGCWVHVLREHLPGQLRRRPGNRPVIIAASPNSPNRK